MASTTVAPANTTTDAAFAAGSRWYESTGNVYGGERCEVGESNAVNAASIHELAKPRTPPVSVPFQWLQKAGRGVLIGRQRCELQ